MPKWSKDAKEFEVKIHYDDEKGSQIRVPKPILEKMDSPETITFVIDGKNIKIKTDLKRAVHSWSKHKKETKT